MGHTQPHILRLSRNKRAMTAAILLGCVLFLVVGAGVWGGYALFVEKTEAVAASRYGTPLKFDDPPVDLGGGRDSSARSAESYGRQSDVSDVRPQESARREPVRNVAPRTSAQPLRGAREDAAVGEARTNPDGRSADNAAATATVASEQGQEGQSHSAESQNTPEGSQSSSLESSAVTVQNEERAAASSEFSTDPELVDEVRKALEGKRGAVEPRSKQVDDALKAAAVPDDVTHESQSGGKAANGNAASASADKGGEPVVVRLFNTVDLFRKPVVGNAPQWERVLNAEKKKPMSLHLMVWSDYQQT